MPTISPVSFFWVLGTMYCPRTRGQLATLSEVPISQLGVCSSRAFLIHKWMAIHAFKMVFMPGGRRPGMHKHP
jgi:hypothetical protein